MDGWRQERLLTPRSGASGAYKGLGASDWIIVPNLDGSAAADGAWPV
jgi:hypothetical protein